MSKQFSKSFSSFSEWKAQAPDTDYARRISRLHALHPTASLSQLRRHEAKHERPLSQTARTPEYAIPYDELSFRQKRSREKSLHVISMMRKEHVSLARASKRFGITPSTVIRATNAVKLEGRRYKPKSRDSVERKILIYENGVSKYITVKDSRTASIIGHYFTKIKKYRQGLIASFSFSPTTVTDANGKTHTLETDEDEILGILKSEDGFSFYWR